MLNVIDMQTSAPASIEEARKELQLRIDGDVILPGDTSYDAVRKAWNLTVQQRPKAIVIANSKRDVVEAVRFACGEGLAIAFQSPGYEVTLPADESILVITSRMTKVQANT